MTRFRLALILVVAISLGISGSLKGAEKESPIDKDLSEFWKTRALHVIQKRKYEKDKRWELGFFTGVIPNDAFITYVLAGINVGYNFNEYFAIELTAMYPGGIKSDLSNFLESNIEGVTVRLAEKLLMLSHINFVWTPFYGKISVMNRKIAHFGLYLTAGAGAVMTQWRGEGDTEDHLRGAICANFGLGFKFWLTSFMVLRFDFKQYFYAKSQGGVSNPSAIMIGLGFLPKVKR